MVKRAMAPSTLAVSRWVAVASPTADLSVALG